ncbi:ROK family protein [Williamsia sp. 1135]|uniref:ROK family protein n=1 Tax=Williamsia sp. 1135 TaxID=1889262 RepID=UPI000A11A645|nr:ROK family protein [Williamsia sp. 1135]ORM27767.1 sugar kinase [Williamsia sp. 1135]
MTATLDHRIATTTTRPSVTRPTGSRVAAPARPARPLGVPSPKKAAVKLGSARAGIHIATPQLHLSTKPAAVVLRAARLHGPVFRDAASGASGLSISTVNRQVSALLKVGLLRERADLAPAGAIGRPRLPFELNTAEFLTVGIHIGLKVTSITTHDLFHRVVGAIQIPTPIADSPEQTLTAIGLSAKRFLSRWQNKKVLWAGVALAGRVDKAGRVTHSRLGWQSAPVGEILASVVGLPISVASHVEAMAAAELLLNPQAELLVDPGQEGGSFVYFYARETVGIAFTVGGSVYTPTAGPPEIGHFPVGRTELLDPHGTGRLEPTVSDTGIVDAAIAAGLKIESVEDVHQLAAEGNEISRAILDERARLLGKAVGLIADIFNPDHVVLGGQAFTDAPSTLPIVAQAVRETSVAERRDVRVSRSGATVQQQAAGAVSLDAIYSDPVEALSRTA